VSNTNYAYANDGRLSMIVHLRNGSGGSGSIANYNQQFDANERLEERIVQFFASSGSSPTQLYNEQVEYEYNAAGQLDELRTQIDGSTLTYADIPIDNAGNQTPPSTIIGRNNRLLSDTEFVYRYDAEGNLTTKREKTSGRFWTYTWDHRGRMAKSRGGGPVCSSRKTCQWLGYPTFAQVGKRINSVPNNLSAIRAVIAPLMFSDNCGRNFEPHPNWL